MQKQGYLWVQSFSITGLDIRFSTSWKASLPKWPPSTASWPWSVSSVHRVTSSWEKNWAMYPKSKYWSASTSTTSSVSTTRLCWCWPMKRKPRKSITKDSRKTSSMPNMHPKWKKAFCKCAKTWFPVGCKCAFTPPRTCTLNSIFAFPTNITNIAMVGSSWVLPISPTLVWVSPVRPVTSWTWPWRTMTMWNIAPMSSTSCGKRLFRWLLPTSNNIRTKPIWAISLPLTNFISRYWLIPSATRWKTISPSSYPMVWRIWSIRRMPSFKVIRCWWNTMACSWPMW